MRTATTHALQAANNANTANRGSSPPPVQLLTEVIGGAGRIGSQFMRLIAQEQDRDWDDAPHIMALPRGVCPGSLSAAGSPIFVCTPAGARWSSLYQATLPPRRRSDLVFCGNGLLPPEAMDADAAVTLMVPHYAVTTVGARAAVAPTAPPTYLAGPHAAMVQRLLRRDGICNTEILSSCGSGTCVEIRVKAAQKLLWASCLWLLCHLERGRPPITVAEVYEEHIEVLFGLVHELWPAFEALLMSQTTTTTTTTNADEAPETTTQLPTLPETLVYFQDYTLSIPDAIPSLDLAIAELADRNGVLAAPNQPLHRQLVEQVAGLEAARSIFGPADEDADGDDGHEILEPPPPQLEAPTIVDLREIIGVAVYSTTTDNKTTKPKPTNIVVVGAGILGSSVALNLARQRGISHSYRITVVDPASNASEPGATTRSSWAWLNANQKRPPSYQQLNALGLHAWRCDPLLADLPDWKGSLVQCDSDGDTDDGDSTVDLSCVGGFYAQPIGPLTDEELRALEPNVQFTKKTLSKATGTKTTEEQQDESASSVYYFPNEGCVDPCEAVQRMRQAAAKAGVEFLWSHNVTRILYENDNPADEVVGIECCELQEQSTAASGESLSSSTCTTKIIEADVVVVAAGTGSAAPTLANLPLQDSRGCVVFAGPAPPPDNQLHESSRTSLTRIIVHAVGKSHVLQRRDGSIVAGGDLEFAGASPSPPSSKKLEKVSTSIPPQSSQDDEQADPLLAAARALAPETLLQAIFSHRAEAARPIPADGLPAVGYVRPGVYSVVSHSGITLAPLLGPLVAAEIAESVSLDILAPYRPTRFFENKDVQHQTSDSSNVEQQQQQQQQIK